MQILIWSGAALTVLGLIGIILSLTLVLRARKADPESAAMQATMRRAMVLNMASFMLSFLGLGAVAAGVILS